MSSGTMERILRLMAEKKASDVYLTAYAPAMIKIHGQTIPINSQVLPLDAPRNLLSEIVSSTRMEELTETGTNTEYIDVLAKPRNPNSPTRHTPAAPRPGDPHAPPPPPPAPPHPLATDPGFKRRNGR